MCRCTGNAKWTIIERNGRSPKWNSNLIIMEMIIVFTAMEQMSHEVPACVLGNDNLFLRLAPVHLLFTPTSQGLQDFYSTEAVRRLHIHY